MEFLKTLGRKQENTLLAHEGIVSVSVEDSPKLFEVHRRILYAECKGLRAALDLAKGREQPLPLGNVSHECFSTVCQWLYSKELVVKELDTDNGGKHIQNNDDGQVNNDDGKVAAKATGDPATHANNQSDQDYIHIEDDAGSVSSNPVEADCQWHAGLDRPGRVYARLVDLYAFASTYAASQLKRAVMLAWQRFGISCNRLPPARVVDRAFARIQADEPLCRYVVLWYGYYNGEVAFDAAEFGSAAPKFLAGVLHIMYQKQAGGCRFDGLDKNWCDFHEHADQKERAECQGTRRKDPDVVAKRAEELWDTISPTRRAW